MATNIHPPQRSDMRGSKAKIKEKVISIASANYIINFINSIKFNTGKDRVIDFLPLFHKYVKGATLNISRLKIFKGFLLKTEIFFWGVNEDVIFTTDSLYYFASKQKDGILYLIKQ